MGRMASDVISLCGVFFLGLIRQQAAPLVEYSSGELCDTEVFRAECRENEVIMMTKLWYGRMKVGKCVEFELGYVDCHRDLLLMADQRCSGKRTCEIRIPDAQFENTRPCLKELKNYMEASYICLPVETVSSEFCRKYNELNVSSGSHGFIANIVTTDTPSCDGTTHPWVISASPGQRINLTLYDFALAGAHASRKHYSHRALHIPQTQEYSISSPNSSSSSSSADSSRNEIQLELCRQYGLLQDGLFGRSRPICGATETRVTRLHLSTTSVVKLWLTAGSAPRDLKRFVIEYQIVGCPDFLHPMHFWFERTALGHGILGCENSDHKWQLHCHNNTWFGSYGNCTVSHGPETGDSVAGNYSADYVYDGVAIVVVIGCSIGIAVLIVIVVVVRWNRN